MKQLLLVAILSLFGAVCNAQTAVLEQKIAQLEKRINDLEERVGKTYEQKLKDYERQLQVGPPKDTKTVDGITVKIMAVEGNMDNGNLVIKMKISNEGIDKKFYASDFEFTDLSGKSYSKSYGAGHFVPSNEDSKTLMRNVGYNFEITFKNVEYTKLMKGAIMKIMDNSSNKKSIQFADIPITWNE